MFDLHSRSSSIALAAGLFLISAATASAQTTVDPSRMIERFKRDTRPTTSPEVVIERQGQEAAPVKGDGKKIFTLNRVVVKGSSVYGEEGPKAAYEKWIGQQVSFADLQAIAQAITAHYRNDGYILSRAVLEPQKVGGGVVQVRVADARQRFEDILAHADTLEVLIGDLTRFSQTEIH